MDETPEGMTNQLDTGCTPATPTPAAPQPLVDASGCCCAAGRLVRSAEVQRADRTVCAMSPNDLDIALTSVRTPGGPSALPRPYRPAPAPALPFHPPRLRYPRPSATRRQEGSHSGRVRWS